MKLNRFGSKGRSNPGDGAFKRRRRERRPRGRPIYSQSDGVAAGEMTASDRAQEIYAIVRSYQGASTGDQR